MAGKHITKENIDRWFDINLDVTNRTIYMGSVDKDYDGYETGVDHLMAEFFIKGMYTLQSKSNEPITVIMNNPGGDWFHGMAIFDAIKFSPCVCTVKVFGHAMSMGSIILQAADHRILMPNSKFMIHYGYDGRFGHSKIVERWADEGKRINHDMENIYINSMLEKEEKEGAGYLAKTLAEIVNFHKSFEFPQPPQVSYTFSKDITKKREEIRVVLKSLLDYDTILTAEETVKLGFADEIFELPQQPGRRRKTN